MNKFLLLVFISVFCAVSICSQQRSPLDSPVVYKIDGMDNIKAKREAYKTVEGEQLSAVIYQSAVKPDEDLNDAVNYLRKNAEKLQIDENRIGIFTLSGNTVAALPFMTDSTRIFIRCGVIYYGMVSAVQNPIPPVARKDLPLMIVRAGLEASAELNKRLDEYVKLLIEQNAPLTFINYAEGHHSFDLVDDTDKSREISRETLDFW